VACAVVLAGAVMFAAIAIARAAHAERYCAHWYGVRVSDGWSYRIERHCARWVHRDREEYYRRYDPRPERVYGYERREADSDPSERGACKTERITAVSDEHKDVDKARTDAIERWRKMVSWSGGGGEFMDYSLAINREFRCGPSSPGDSWAAKGGKAITRLYGAATGQTGPGGPINPEGMNQRCQVWATPCRSRREVDVSPPQ
jgi:hypothetical protein